MIRVVHPGFGAWFFTHPLSRIQGLKRQRIPDPEVKKAPESGSGSATKLSACHRFTLVFQWGRVCGEGGGGERRQWHHWDVRGWPRGTVHIHVVTWNHFSSSDPHVFWPTGSGSISQMYVSGPGPFYHQAKIVNLDFYFFATSFWLFVYENLCKCTFIK